MEVYGSKRHFVDFRYMARRWVQRWGYLPCDQVPEAQIKEFVFERAKTAHTGNKEIKYLRSLFNFGKKQSPPLCLTNPANNISFLPVREKDIFIKYVPPIADITKVLFVAPQEIRDYLYCIWDTQAREGEINKLKWEDINLSDRVVTLYTKKKKGGNISGRPVPMTNRLYNILARRFKERDFSKPWVFWHSYVSSKTKKRCEGPYQDRPKIMKTLCRKAGVKYFRFHALRHSGASIMASDGSVSLRSVQKILGHEQIRTTERYLHSLSESERNATNVFEQKTEITLPRQKESNVDSIP